jgi:hypothetical protein
MTTNIQYYIKYISYKKQLDGECTLSTLWDHITRTEPVNQAASLTTTESMKLIACLVRKVSPYMALGM